MWKKLLNTLEMMIPNSEKIRLLGKISKSETERKNAKNYYKIIKEPSEKAQKLIQEHLKKLNLFLKMKKY